MFYKEIERLNDNRAPVEAMSCLSRYIEPTTAVACRYRPDGWGGLTIGPLDAAEPLDRL
jgi:hypothetical protein